MSECIGVDKSNDINNDVAVSRPCEIGSSPAHHQVQGISWLDEVLWHIG